jgi:hypothetical protein
VPSDSPHLFDIGLADPMKDRCVCLLPGAGGERDHVNRPEHSGEQRRN